MPFTAGSISFTQLHLPSNAPSRHEIVRRLLDAPFKPPKIIGTETTLGFTGPRHMHHLRDTDRDVEHCNGDACVIGCRIDTHKVAPATRKALRDQYVDEARGDRESIGGDERREAIEHADQVLTREIAEGKHTSRWWTQLLIEDDSTILVNTTSSAKLEAIRSEIGRVLGVSPQIVSAGPMALLTAQSFDLGEPDAIGDMQPLMLTKGPKGNRQMDLSNPYGLTGDAPSVPWASRSPEPLDFLGNEFLLWLWWYAASDDEFVLADEEDGSEAYVAINPTLLECAWDFGGTHRISESSGGTPAATMPEVARALANGKWPRAARVHLTVGTMPGLEFTFAGDAWKISSVKLPRESFDDCETQTEITDRRIELTRQIAETMQHLYANFLADRVDNPNSVCHGIGQWIKDLARNRGAA